MHRSGISVSQELAAAFQKATQQNSLLKIQIKEESFILIDTVASTSDRDKDFAAARQLLEQNAPSYILLKLDSQWLVISHVPPTSIVRSKMLYASSRLSLKDGLGGASSFIDDYFISEADECTYTMYQRSLKGDTTEVLTMAERIKQEEALTSYIPDSKLAAMASLPLQITDSAKRALGAILSATQNVQSFHLDPNTQNLLAEELKITNVADVAAYLSKLTEPRFILFNFTHTHESEQSSPTIFVYYCPDSSDRKLRMIYASSKRVVVEACEVAGLQLVKKLEISDAAEINSKALLDELHPKQAEKVSFSKPSRPGRGNARLAGSAASSSSA